MTALTLVALVSIRRWTTDTHAERVRLADATREAETEKSRYIAGQAAMEVERDRMRRDAASGREQLEIQLATARQALADQLEEDRAKISCDALEAALIMLPGLLSEGRPEHGTVIGFPAQPARHQRAQEPKRDRGATRG
nr:hypothetical protein OH820_18120 [Streptomyces sp. NBC_00857]